MRVRLCVTNMPTHAYTVHTPVLRDRSHRFYCATLTRREGERERERQRERERERGPDLCGGVDHADLVACGLGQHGAERVPGAPEDVGGVVEVHHTQALHVVLTQQSKQSLDGLQGVCVRVCEGERDGGGMPGLTKMGRA